MYEEVTVLTHSSIKISGKKVVYFDPFKIEEESKDADLIFITHDHYDHYSPEDIQKVAKDTTWLIMPGCMRGQEEKFRGLKCKFLHPEGILEAQGLMVKAVPAYNRHKLFHPKSKGYLGYLLTMEEVRYYVAGDTDLTADNQKLKCDVALVPVGGKFTMDYKEAAKLVNQIMPKLAIPTHYGSIAGKQEDGDKFAELVDSRIEVRVVL